MISIKKDFLVCGISIRTNNTLEMTEEGKIKKLLERFFTENLLERIPNKVGADLFSVYFNYESDYTGDYDYLVGVKVKSEYNRDEFKTVQIQPGHYLKLKTQLGSLPQVVYDLWGKIWKMSKKELGGSRSYQTDYEIYGKEAQNPKHANVDIYLGIQK